MPWRVFVRSRSRRTRYMLTSWSMSNETTPESPPSTRAFERLRPVADRVDVFARESGRAAAEGDVDLAAALLAAGGERSRCDMALQAAWADLLGGQTHASPDMSARVSVLVLLEKITDLAAAICRAIVGLGGRGLRALPSMPRLAPPAP